MWFSPDNGLDQQQAEQAKGPHSEREMFIISFAITARSCYQAMHFIVVINSKLLISSFEDPKENRGRSNKMCYLMRRYNLCAWSV